MTTGLTRQFDNQLIVIIAVLTAFGTTIMYSASSPFAANFGSNMFFLKRHIIALFIGIGALFFFSMFNYRNLFSFAPLFLALAALMVLMGFIMNNTDEPSRWLIYTGKRKMITTSDFVRISLIIFTAAYLDRKRREIKIFTRGLLPYTLLTGSLVLAVLLQPDLGTALALSLLIGAIFFIGGVPVKQLAACVLALVPAVGVSLIFRPYQWTRITSWLNPTEGIRHNNWQSFNSKIAIGNGGLFGTGIGDSRMKHGFLPEAHTDFIYSVIGEELGFFVSVIIILLFAWLFIRAVKISQHAPDPFGMFLALGIGLNIALYSAINIAYVCGLLPTTGLPLPFISYGGSHTVLTLAEMGILLNISRWAKIPPHGRLGGYSGR